MTSDTVFLQQDSVQCTFNCTVQYVSPSNPQCMLGRQAGKAGQTGRAVG